MSILLFSTGTYGICTVYNTEYIFLSVQDTSSYCLECVCVTVWGTVSRRVDDIFLAVCNVLFLLFRPLLIARRPCNKNVSKVFLDTFAEQIAAPSLWGKNDYKHYFCFFWSSSPIRHFLSKASVGTVQQP